MQASQLYGALFENLIVANLRKSHFNADNQHPLYYYRDNHQLEVDLLESTGGALILTEIKATTTYRDRLRTNWGKVAALVKNPVRKRVIYGAAESRTVGEVEVVSWREAQ